MARYVRAADSAEKIGPLSRDSPYSGSEYIKSGSGDQGPSISWHGKEHGKEGTYHEPTAIGKQT